MFDVSTVNKRYFEITLYAEDADGIVTPIKLDVEAPKLKTVRKLSKLKNAKEDGIDELCEAIKKILSKNKEKYKVSDEIVENLDFDQLMQILEAYFNWLGDERNSKN